MAWFVTSQGSAAPRTRSVPLASLALGAALALALSAPARAAYTTVDVSSYLNANIAFNPQTFPLGVTTGNQGTGIPVATSAYGPGGITGSWIASASATGVLDVQLDVSGESTFYALLNNYYGTPNANEYTITIKATNGDTATYNSIGGVDTRDYNANIFTNTIANTTTPWFDNGIGQRLDLRAFSLPAYFATDTISDFIITQLQPNDPALFTGLSFSTAAGTGSAPVGSTGSGTAPTTVPEPASLPVLLAGGMLTAALARRRRA